MTYKPEHIAEMKRTERLKLSKLHALSHYFFVLIFCMAPVYLVYDLIRMNIGTYDGDNSPEELVFSLLAFVALAVLVFLIQRRRLKFRVIRIKHTTQDLYEAMQRTAKTLNWRWETKNGDFIRAYRGWDWSSSWGEMITIIHEGDTIWLNSISDPNEKLTFSSFGWNKKNINTFLFNLTQVLQNIPASSWFEDLEAKKWYSKKIFRYIAYFCCACMLALSIFLLIKGAFTLAITLIAIVGFYVHSDLTATKT